jgi:hypothetical protein
VHDRLASYGRFLDAIHQQCRFHLLTRCRKLLEIAKGVAACFPLQVKGLLLQCLSIRDRFLSKDITDQGLAIPRGKLHSAFGKLMDARLLHTSNARLQKFLINHHIEIFWHLECPAAIPAKNNESESDLRPNAIARKLSGDNRSDSGRQAQQTLPSIIRTCHKLSLDAIEWIKSPRPSSLGLGKQVQFSRGTLEIVHIDRRKP